MFSSKPTRKSGKFLHAICAQNIDTKRGSCYKYLGKLSAAIGSASLRTG